MGLHVQEDVVHEVGQPCIVGNVGLHVHQSPKQQVKACSIP